MPRRTYNPRTGRRRPYANAGEGWAAAMRALLERDRWYRTNNGRNHR